MKLPGFKRTLSAFITSMLMLSMSTPMLFSSSAQNYNFNIIPISDSGSYSKTACIPDYTYFPTDYSRSFLTRDIDDPYEENGYVRYEFYYKGKLFEVIHPRRGQKAYPPHQITNTPYVRILGWYHDPEYKYEAKIAPEFIADKSARFYALPGNITNDPKPDPEPGPQPNPNDGGAKPVIKNVESVQRISGSNRYYTAVKTSRDSYKSAAVAVLASGKSYPDALAAGSLSRVAGGPVLLSDGKGLSDELRGKINRLGVKKVYIVSGSRLIPQSVVNALEELGIEVERISGNDRYETSALIADKILSMGGNREEIIVASGLSPYDALSISAYAAKNARAVLLTNGEGLSPSVRGIISNFKRAIVVGGESTITRETALEIEEYGPIVHRIMDADRYETSLIIASSQYFGKSEGLVFADGRGFADALTGINISITRDSPIVLVNPKGGNVDLKEFAHHKRVYIIGGENSVSTEHLNNTVF